MKHLYLNLKRFDVPVEYGGVNRVAPVADWGAYIVGSTQDALAKYDPNEVEFAQFFPEAHILGAVAAKKPGSPVKVGCQGVHRADTAVGGNFGAFTTLRPASAAKALGCESVIIGHCEERNFYNDTFAEAGVSDTSATNRILNQEVLRATERGLNVLFCIGEKSEEQPAVGGRPGQAARRGPRGRGQEQGRHRLRARVEHRPRQDACRQGLHHHDRALC